MLGGVIASGDNVGVRQWYRAGVACVVAAIVLSVAVQVVSGDYLPPEISFSQYGVGPHGWIFSLLAVTFSLGPLCFVRYRPARRLAVVLLWISFAGSLLMAIVRTDPSGLQLSLNSRVHTAGSVLALFGLPLGVSFALDRAATRWRAAAWALTAVVAICLTLLLISAAGVDTAGLGPAHSWAFWQTGAFLADIGLLVVHALGVRTVPPRAPLDAAQDTEVGARRRDHIV